MELEIINLSEVIQTQKESQLKKFLDSIYWLWASLENCLDFYLTHLILLGQFYRPWICINSEENFESKEAGGMTALFFLCTLLCTCYDLLFEDLAYMTPHYWLSICHSKINEIRAGPRKCVCNALYNV